MLQSKSAKYMRDLTEKEERAAFGKRLKRKEVWTAEYRLKHDTATLTRGTAASTKRLHKYSRLEAANTGHQSYLLMEIASTGHCSGVRSSGHGTHRRLEEPCQNQIPAQ